MTTKNLIHAIEGGSEALHLLPWNITTQQFESLLLQWLESACTDSKSIKQWLNAYFPGTRSEWIHDVLKASWDYSVEYLSRKSDGDRIHKLLVNSWLMALSATMFSLPLTIPLDSRQRAYNEFKRLGYSNLGSVLSWPTSKMTTRVFKSLFFSMYRNLVREVISGLQHWHVDRRVRDYPGHINCTLISIMVAFCQMETALCGGHRDTNLSNSEYSFQDCVSHISTMDSVLSTIMVYIRHRCMDSLGHLRKPSDPGQAIDNRKAFVNYWDFAERIEEIKQKYKEGMFITNQQLLLTNS